MGRSYRNMAKPAVNAVRRQESEYAHNGLSKYVAVYLEAMLVGGMSEHTVRMREHHLVWFIGWCDERGLDDPTAVTKPMLERYQRHLYYYRKQDGAPLSHSSQSGRLTSVKMFFKWLTQQNYLLMNPASELVLPKGGRRLPQAILTNTEIARILTQPDLDLPNGLRDRAILEALYSTGMRRNELVWLKLQDIQWSTGAVWIRQGKGDRDRLVPIGDRAMAWIQRYLSDVRPNYVMWPDDGIVFLTDYGQPLVRNRIGSMVKRYMRKAGVDKPGACHVFRHTMATHMLENGADVRFIQAMLGHANLSTTQVYTHVSISKLKEIHSATHPAKGKGT